MPDKNRSSMNRAFFWNMMGSGMNAASTMVLTVVATRLAGVEHGGILGLAFGLCQIFGTLSSFEVRAFQSTDIRQEHSFAEYFTTRLSTAVLVTIICAVYVFGFRYSADKASIVFAVCMYKILESVSDVFQGAFQQRDCMEYAGKSVFYKVSAACAAYIAVMLGTGNPVLSAWAMPCASAAGILLYDVRKALALNIGMGVVFHPSASARILLECFPLAASSFMNMYILNAEKFQIDISWPDLQGYWTALFMPAAVINLLSLFAFRPLLTSMASAWNERRLSRLTRYVVTLLLWIVAMTGLALIGAYFLGIPVLELLYGLELGQHRMVLMIVLAGGGLNAVATFLWYVITVMRRQRYLILTDGITFAVTLCAVPVLVGRGALMGAAWAYVVSMTVRALLLLGMTVLFQIGANRTFKVNS